MKLKNISPAILTAATSMLQPYAPELSPTALLEAVKAYDPSNGQAIPIPIEKPLTRREVASFLKCSMNTVNRYMNAGRLRRIRLTDRSVRIDPASVRALLSLETETIQQPV